MDADPFELEDIQLATRNRGMPLEALRYDVTPTGLHYLLVHFDIPDVEPSAWRLLIGGNVERERSVGLEDLRALPRRTLTVTMECAGNGRALMRPRPHSQPWVLEAIGTATWTGARLREVLEPAGIREDTVDLVFTGADHGVQGDVEQDYQRALSPAVAFRDEVMLAYEMNGRPLEPQHGAPVRLLVPGWYGMTSVKWLTRIEAITELFHGYQQDSYRYRKDDDDPGEPVSEIRVRALMIPPGHPDYYSRARIVDVGPVDLRGRAWAGPVGIARVEVGVDGVWSDATLEDPVDRFAWRGWSFRWKARSGEHELSVRATDERGDVQPAEQRWNAGGYANTAVQTIRVTAR